MRTLEARRCDTKPPVEDFSCLIETVDERYRPGMLWLVLIGMQERKYSFGNHSFQEILTVY